MNTSLTIGSQVRIRMATPPGHVRTPYFVRGKTGIICDIAGYYPNPEELAYGRDGLPNKTLYRVQFKQTDLWNDYNGKPQDSTIVDIYEHWLEPI